MRAHPLTAALVTLALTACSSSRHSVATEPPPDFRLPEEVVLIPSVWETAGSEMTPELVVIDVPAERNMRFEFEYDGPGRVEVPGAVVVEAGGNEAKCGTFSAKAVKEAGEGVVHVYLKDTDSGASYLVADWPVLHRPSIIQGMSYHRVRPMSDDQLYAALVAVEFDPMEGEMETPVERGDWLEFDAQVQRQGRFAPEVTVVTDVTKEMFPSVDPRDFTFDGDRKVVFITVSQPDFPPVRRAYLEVEAFLGGDNQKIFIALPNR